MPTPLPPLAAALAAKDTFLERSLVLSLEKDAAQVQLANIASLCHAAGSGVDSPQQVIGEIQKIAEAPALDLSNPALTHEQVLERFDHLKRVVQDVTEPSGDDTPPDCSVKLQFESSHFAFIDVLNDEVFIDETAWILRTRAEFREGRHDAAWALPELRAMTEQRNARFTAYLDARRQTLRDRGAEADFITHAFQWQQEAALSRDFLVGFAAWLGSTNPEADVALFKAKSASVTPSYTDSQRLADVVEISVQALGNDAEHNKTLEFIVGIASREFTKGPTRTLTPEETAKLGEVCP